MLKGPVGILAPCAQVGAGKTHVGKARAVGAAANGDDERLDARVLHRLARKLDELHMGQDLLFHVVVLIGDGKLDAFAAVAGVHERRRLLHDALALLEALAVVVANDVVERGRRDIALDRAQVEEPFAALGGRGNLGRGKKRGELAGQKRGVAHAVLRRTRMDHLARDFHDSARGVEVLVLNGTGIAAVHRVGKVCAKAGDIEQVGTLADLLVRGKADAQLAAAHPQGKEEFCGMTIKGMVYDDKKAAGERLLLARQEMPNADMMLLGTYRGFELNIRFDSFKNEHQAVLRAELSYPVSLGDDARGNITRLDNAIDNFADRIADAENALQNLEQQKQAAEVEVAKPFAQEEELAEKSARLAELNALLNIDRDRSSSQDAPEETEETETPATRPSVLAALGEKTNQPEPVKPFRSYYDKDGDAR